MNTIQVGFEIRDVESETAQKKKSSRKSTRSGIPRAPTLTTQNVQPSYRPEKGLAELKPPKVPSSAKLVSENSIPAGASSSSSSSQYVFRHNGGSPAATHLPPKRASSAGLLKPRRGSIQHEFSNKPTWDINVTCPNRDDLIIQQDLEVLRYRARHEIEDPADLPQPNLLDSSHRKYRKHMGHVDHRDRLVHHSVKAAVNDPLPFHPLLKDIDNLGIHNEQWHNDYTHMPDKTVEWAKPLEKTDKKGRDQFYKEYSLPDPMPPGGMNVQHSMASVASTYTRAALIQHGLKRDASSANHGDNVIVVRNEVV
mmetsp:Transcript_28006/g.47078  ORF Transcript_28006/g.47078 Transcript_28006/m.47078 type:complete len:310 (-) Transcript_28006:97-1026(-)|eukprot:CAMPEP_0175014902 /NCGR_PEP_ID=MMETSP0005-20121125/10854_1 /TAXON_ID=420556 /ORGANISM="Ochromonas sp., Strain CCMP1393" /LENGTH=309 /DNA_ID=CAMNT_0016271765 /DNA_START=35 /DNA_END=964 /DNA_ORIENTATION=+